MEQPVIPISGHIAWFERALALAETEENGPDAKTLFVQLNGFEIFLVQFGLWWVSKMYGTHAVAALGQKLNELVEAQAFCDCENCRAERGEELEDQ